MEWLLLIGCIGMKCTFGSTQVSLPSQEECQKLSDQFTGSYGPDQPMYFSKCFGTADAYSGDKGAHGCATSVLMPNGYLRAVSVPCLTTAGKP